MSLIVTSTKYDFNVNEGSHCEQGADFNRMFIWEMRDGSIIDLTGYTAKMQVRRSNKTLIVELNTENNTIILNAQGEIHLRLDSSVTSTLQPGTFKYDLFLYSNDSNDDDVRLIEGNFVISPQVTI